MGYRPRACIGERDANEAEIVAALEGAFCSVQPITQGGGVPDLLVGRIVNGKSMCFLLEVKVPKGTLNAKQMAWHATWRGHVAVVRTVDEALNAVGINVT